MRTVLWAAAHVLGWAALLHAADPQVILDEASYWRQYYRFDVNRVSPAALRAEGPAVLGPKGLDKVRKDADAWVRHFGLDPAKADWRDHVLVANRGAREFIPTPAPIPAGWFDADFDDSAWVRQRHPFQGGGAAQVTQEVLGQYDESVDLRLHTALYRGRFTVDDPQRAGRLTVRLVYSGGARVFVNGREIARGHLPPGDLAPDACAEDYPAKAYGPGGAALVRRALGPVPVPADALVAGRNVLALEVRASRVHPVVLLNPIQPNWGGPRKPFPHARLLSVQLRGAAPGARSPAPGPAGLQVWAEDMHHRVETGDHLPAGEAPGAVRFVGAKNGRFSAQIVVRSDAALAGVTVTPGDLALEGGAATLPASAIAAAGMAPYPADEFTLAALGDERGLNAAFPDAAALARAESGASAKPCIYDHITPAAPAAVRAGAARPVWLVLAVPPGAAAGTYKGAIEVSAQGVPPVRLPVEAEIANWALPDPAKYRTLVGCEQNPYAVARQYGAALWSERHFALLESSFRELGRIGNQWLNVPVLRGTEMGNRDDSPIRWIRKRDGSMAFDYGVLDRYLDVAARHAGPPRVIHFIVMHGMRSAATPPAPPEVNVADEAGGRARPVAVETSGGNAAQVDALWKAFAASLYGHLKAKGLEGRMLWGAPWEMEADPRLKTVLASAAPGVGWTAGPHEMMANGTYAKNEQFYKLVADIRYHGGWPSFRNDQGWKSRTVHLLNPRVGGTCLALHTTSYPLAFRALPDRALAMGRGGFTRVGADAWAATQYSGMAIPKWLTGMPVLFLLWPGRDGAEPSARFEALREGVQEAEARIYIEQSLDSGRVPQAVAARARQVLADHFRGTDFFMGNSLIYSLERNYAGWQERSRRLYAAAAEVSRSLR